MTQFMPGHVLLIGGGEISKGETRAIDERVKSLAPLQSKLLFFPTAAGDSDGYIETIQQIYRDVFEVIPIVESLGRATAVQHLSTAQAVYLGGGRTDLLLSLFRRWELVTPLRALLERGGIVAGMSAGAQALSAWYTDFETDGPMETKVGWDVAHTYCLVHAEADQIAGTFDTYRKSEAQENAPFIAIGERAAWHIHDGGAEKIGDGTVWFASVGAVDSEVKAL